MSEKKDPRETMRPAVLVSLEPLPGAPHLAVVTVRAADGEPLPGFQAGQYAPVAFEHDGEVAVRYYSMASAPQAPEQYEYYVIDPGKGGATAALFGFAPGQELWVGAPGGKFTLERTDRSHLAFLGTGTGLAPCLSMLRHLAAEAKAGRPVPATLTLWHGARSSADLGYRSELERLQRAEGLDFLYLPCVSRAEGDPSFDSATMIRGRADEAFCQLVGLPSPNDQGTCTLPEEVPAEAIRARHPAADTAVFLCGNPEMIQGLERVAAGTDWEAGLVFERWW